MVDNKKFIKSTIELTFNHFLIWNYNQTDNKNIQQWTTKYNITENKHLYLILTKRKLNKNRDNIYLEVFFTKFNNKNKILIHNEYSYELSNNYKHLKSIFVTKYPNLIKLYAIIKYENNNSIWKNRFVENLKYWTENDYLKWEKNKDNHYICYDLKNQYGYDVYIIVYEYNYLNIYLNNYLNNYKHNINYMNSKNLYKLIEQKFSKK